MPRDYVVDGQSGAASTTVLARIVVPLQDLPFGESQRGRGSLTMYPSRMTDGRRKVLDEVRITPRPLETIIAFSTSSNPIARRVVQTFSGA